MRGIALGWGPVRNFVHKPPAAAGASVELAAGLAAAVWVGRLLELERQSSGPRVAGSVEGSLCRVGLLVVAGVAA